MAVKTFTTGEVLTASDTNTYLNNGGLVYITSTTFSSSNTVQINNCFTTSYLMYRVILTTTAVSANVNLYFRLAASGTASSASYYWGSSYVAHSGLSGTSNGSNVPEVNPAYTGNAYPQGVQTVELFSVADAAYTVFTVSDIRHDSTLEVFRNGGGIHTVATAYDGIVFGLGSGATMTGTLSVYGYRKA